MSLATQKSEKRPEVTANLPAQHITLPLKPVILIKRRPLGLIDIKSLWEYRQLYYLLILRDLKIRYRQTFLGILWVLLQPLATMLIFTYFFGRLAKISSDGMAYPVFYYAGLICWIFFSNTVTSCSHSLVMDRSLITKVYFPRLIIPMAIVSANFVDLLIALSLLFILALGYDIRPTWYWLMMLIPLVLMAIFTLSIGMLFGALNVRYRDIRYVLPFTLQLIFFITPIIFPLNIVPPQQRWLIMLNPLTGAIEAFRAFLANTAPNWSVLTFSLLSTLIVFYICAFVFRKMERSFAEHI